MVENFTKKSNNVESAEIESFDSISFEKMIKKSMNKFAKVPSKKSIENILNYSKTLEKRS